MKTLILIVSMVIALAPAAHADQLTVTPEQTAGPFYPGRAVFGDASSDLTNSYQALGRIILLDGRVVDRNGVPIPNAEVQIWQTDGDKGRYLTEETDKPLDPGFNYHGKSVTDETGNYRLTTVRPIEYEASDDWMRPDHIHFRVFVDGKLRLTTQMYFADDAALIAKDKILQSLTPEERASVIVTLMPNWKLSANLRRPVDDGFFQIVLK